MKAYFFLRRKNGRKKTKTKENKEIGLRKFRIKEKKTENYIKIHKPKV